LQFHSWIEKTDENKTNTVVKKTQKTHYSKALKHKGPIELPDNFSNCT